MIFLAPLLALYEGGVLWLGGDKSERCGTADTWMRWALDTFESGTFWPRPVVLVVLLLWTWWRWADRPDDPVTLFVGTAFESCVFAFALWQFSRNFGPIVEGLGVRLQITVQTPPLAQILTFIGAGIYEEVLFRLGLFAGLYGVLRVVRLPVLAAVVIAAAVGAIAFAYAHHIGPYGEPVRADYFVFRAIAGLYFTLLFVLRGFGIAVGAHVGYDVLVGVAVC